MISQEELELRNSLSHHGILGQKWGVRRFQNSDGSLTAAGKKKISKEYKKASIAGDTALQKNYSSMYLKTYNKAVEKMNTSELEKFNSAQEKKYVDNVHSPEQNRLFYESYMQDYDKVFNKIFEPLFNKELNDFYISDKNYQRADKLLKDYGMEKWDDLAKSNEAGLSELRSKYA